MNSDNIIGTEQFLDFIAGSAMIFSGFAITANSLKNKITDIEGELKKIQSENRIEWTTLSIVAQEKGLTKDAIRKRLQNGDFEEGVDFKYDGNKIIVHQEAVVRLRRLRRSNNG